MEMLAGIDWNTLLRDDDFSLLLFLSLAALVALVTVITVQWRRIRVAEAEAALKLRMVERGLSVEEIERVLRAGLAAGHHKERRRSATAQSCCS